MKKLKRGEKPENWKEESKRFPEYYRKRHPEWSEAECKEASASFNKSVNWQCIEYYIKKYPDKSLDECERLRKEAIAAKNKNHPSHIEYYRKRFPNASESELQNMMNAYIKENNFQSIEYYRKRFPNASESELQNMLSEAKNDYLKKRPDNTGSNNPAHRTRTSEQERRERSPKCIEFYNKRYPKLSQDEREELLNKHMNMVNVILTDKSKQVKCVEYWTKLGYSTTEAREIISKSQSTFTLEKCISKYGEDEGVKRFNQRQKKWLKSLILHFEECGDGRSRQSSFASNIIDEICGILDIHRPSTEKFMTDSHGNHYAFDFCFGKKIIEFNGDYWHCNPKFYKCDDVNPTKNMTASEIWDYDNRKIECAKDNGYDVLVIWENDVNDFNVVKKCIDFLNE